MPKANPKWSDGFAAGKAGKPRKTKLTGVDRKMWLSGYDLAVSRRAAGDE